MKQSDLVIADLVNGGLVPKGIFAIDQTLLEAYMKLYDFHAKSRNPKGNGKFDISLARKLAGLNLMKLKRTRGAKSKDFKEGFVYLIKNPAWEGFTKIGITTNLDNRLSTYQTSDPHRGFYVDGYEFVLNSRKVEEEILTKFNVHLAKGEWLQDVDSLRIVRYIRAELLSDGKTNWRSFR